MLVGGGVVNKRAFAVAGSSSGVKDERFELPGLERSGSGCDWLAFISFPIACFALAACRSLSIRRIGGLAGASANVDEGPDDEDDREEVDSLGATFNLARNRLAIPVMDVDLPKVLGASLLGLDMIVASCPDPLLPDRYEFSELNESDAESEALCVPDDDIFNSA